MTTFFGIICENPVRVPHLPLALWCRDAGRRSGQNDDEIFLRGNILGCRSGYGVDREAPGMSSRGQKKAAVQALPPGSRRYRGSASTLGGFSGYQLNPAARTGFRAFETAGFGRPLPMRGRTISARFVPPSASGCLKVKDAGWERHFQWMVSAPRLAGLSVTPSRGHHQSRSKVRACGVVTGAPALGRQSCAIRH